MMRPLSGMFALMLCASCSGPAVVGDEGTSPESCVVPTMPEIYPGPLAPNPAATQPRAGACIDQAHDVIIVLGCPSEEDGGPSPCQVERADIAASLKEHGYGDRFIVTGAAVHNEFEEATALHQLLVARGIDDEVIADERQAEHTDENIYFSSRMMQQRGYRSALVVSDGAGQLLYNALCDSNCCVDLGRLTVVELDEVVVGHYVLYPDAEAVTEAECDYIEDARMGVCINLGKRRACKSDFKL